MKLQWTTSDAETADIEIQIEAFQKVSSALRELDQFEQHILFPETNTTDMPQALNKTRVLYHISQILGDSVGLVVKILSGSRVIETWKLIEV